MDEKAYLALDAIGRNAGAELADLERWVKAFKAIRWVMQTANGPALTPAGRQAREEMAYRKRSNPDVAGPAGRNATRSRSAR